MVEQTSGIGLPIRRIGESLNWEWVELTKDYYMEFKGALRLSDGI